MKKLLNCHYFVATLAALLISMFTLILPTDVQAMTLNDLQGRYRVMQIGDEMLSSGIHGAGTIVEFKRDGNGSIVGIVIKPGSNTYLTAGREVVQDVFVDNGIITCVWTPSAGFTYEGANFKVYSNGASIRIERSSRPNGWYWIMKRLN